MSGHRRSWKFLNHSNKVDPPISSTFWSSEQWSSAGYQSILKKVGLGMFISFWSVTHHFIYYLTNKLLISNIIPCNVTQPPFHLMSIFHIRAPAQHRLKTVDYETLPSNAYWFLSCNKELVSSGNSGFSTNGKLDRFATGNENGLLSINMCMLSTS